MIIVNIMFWHPVTRGSRSNLWKTAVADGQPVFKELSELANFLTLRAPSWAHTLTWPLQSWLLQDCCLIHAFWLACIHFAVTGLGLLQNCTKQPKGTWSTWPVSCKTSQDSNPEELQKMLAAAPSNNTVQLFLFLVQARVSFKSGHFILQQIWVGLCLTGSSKGQSASWKMDG